MTKERIQAAIDAETRTVNRILAIARPMIPAKHLAIHAEVKKQFEDAGPSEAWRILVGDGLVYDHQTTLSNHSKSAN